MDDLYAGLPAPRPAGKRQRDRELREPSTTATATVEEESAVAAAAAAPRPAKRQRVLELPKTLDKLQRYMLSDKKFAKACPLLVRLVDEQLSAETRELFLPVLTLLIDAKGGEWSGRREFAALVTAILSKKDAWLADSDDDDALLAERLGRWEFLAVTHAQLMTDDTYQFVKAAKAVKLRLERALARQADGDGSAAQETLHAELMPALRTVHSKLHVAWAAGTVESVLAVCTRHRMAFGAADREQVDAWTKSVRDRRSAPAVARSAGSDARRNIVAMDASNASQAKPKVGVSNHPLFNRG